MEELEEDEEEEEEEEEEGEEMDEEEDAADGLATPSGLITPSGMASAVPSGLETPEFIELRKQRPDLEDDDDGRPRNLYTVLPEQTRNVGGTNLMGSQHGYDIAGQKPRVLDREPSRRVNSILMTQTHANVYKGKSNGIDVALDPTVLEREDGRVPTAELQSRYDEAVERKKQRASWLSGRSIRHGS